jgi:hypothetical protein
MSGKERNMDVFGLVVSVVVTVAVVVGILLFERQRAERIDEDLRESRRGRRSGDDGP